MRGARARRPAPVALTLPRQPPKTNSLRHDQFHIESGLINVAGKTAQSEDLYCVVVVYYLLVRSVLPTSSIPPTSNVAERATVPVLIHRSLPMVASRAMDEMRFSRSRIGANRRHGIDKVLGGVCGYLGELSPFWSCATG